MNMYASKNRQKKISLAFSPLFSNILVETNVVPQTETMAKASR